MLTTMMMFTMMMMVAMTARAAGQRDVQGRALHHHPQGGQPAQQGGDAYITAISSDVMSRVLTLPVWLSSFLF